MSNAPFNIVHFHFHRRKTGVTKSIEQLLPFLQSKLPSAVFGYGLSAPKINFGSLLKLLFSKEKSIVHVHRNNEMMLALLLRLFGGRFALFMTRHSATPPSGLTRYLMNKADRKIFLTNGAFFDTSTKNVIIPHGVDTSAFKTSGLPLSEKKQIGVVGRIRETKGQKIVISALTAFLKKHPDWKLTFVGKVDQKQYAQDIKSLAEVNRLESQVTFLPQTEEIHQFYQNCAMVIVASFSEGFSLVPLEAIACGCTVIATKNVGVHSALIQPRENGFLFPAGDEKQLAKIVDDVVENNGFFSETVLRNSIAQWEMEKIAEQTIAAYRACLK